MPPTKIPLLGRLAVHHKLVTPDQLEEALRDHGQGAPASNLGEILLARGFVSKKQLAALLKAQQEIVARERTRRAAELGAAAGSEEPAPAPAEAGSRAAAAEAAKPAEPRPARSTRGPARSARAPTPAAVEAADAGLGAVGELLRDAVQRGASDIHVHAGAPVRLRIHGALAPEPT